MRKTKLFSSMFAILLAGLMFIQPLQAGEMSTITVNGTGAVSLAPDIATVNLGVSTQNANPQHALEENNALTANLITTLRNLDISEENIRTAHFFIDAVWGGHDWATITGYRVSNTVTVTIHDIDRLGDIMAAAVAAGANVSHGISFGISDSAEAYEQALAMAIADAERKARAMARALNSEIIGRNSVIEIGGMFTPVARTMGAVAMEADMVLSSVPIEAGELTVTANVQIVYSVTQ